MSIKDYKYWNPILDIRALQGFPSYIAAEIRDRVVDFELKDKRHMLDEIKLTLNNYDGRLLDPAYLGLGMSFKVSYGYPGIMASRAMQCRKANGAARVGGLGKNSGPSTTAGGLLTLILKSQVWNMNFERTVSVQDGPLAERQDLLINNATVPATVRAIARSYGYRSSNLFIEELEEEPVFEESSIPSRYSAAEWISEQAQRRGWTFAIDEHGFHFHSSGYPPATEAGGIEELSWFNGDPDVILWNIKGDLNIPQGMRQVGLHNESKFGATVGPNGEKSAVTFKNLNPSDATDTYMGHFDPEVGIDTEDDIKYELPTVSKNKVSPTISINMGDPTRESIEKSAAFFERTSKRWKLQLRLVGNPRISARKKIKLSNFGPLIDGIWIVRECTHSIKPNQVYLTEIDEAVRDKSNVAQAGDALFGVANLSTGKKVVVVKGVTSH